MVDQMKNTYLSPLAVLIPQPQDTINRTKPKPYGIMVHTTGRGLLDSAKKEKLSPLAMAIKLYTQRKGYGPHYVLDQDGDLIQIADERERMGHAGVTTAERKLYLSGAWKKGLSKVALIRWTERWALDSDGYASPSLLYPSSSPNNDYIGVELIPNAKATFSDRQYELLNAFVEDFEKRHALQIRLPGVELPTPRLLGHEDVEPLTRWDAKGGWDPGSLRAAPRFDWSRLFLSRLVVPLARRGQGGVV